MEQPAQPERILRVQETCKIRGRSRSSHYADISLGLFVPPVSIGARAVGHPQREVAAIQEARIAGRSNNEIRELVIELVNARGKAV